MHRSPPTRRLALAAAALAAALAVALPAAASAAPDCQPSGATTTCTFAYTGAQQTWTVPAGVTEATFDVYGAQGGGSTSTNGLGGEATATITVTPADTLQVNVGGAAGPNRCCLGGPGGFNGGGPGGPGSVVGGYGGGGASDVRSGALGLTDRLIVGGGGGSVSAGGGGGGTSGTRGLPSPSPSPATGGGFGTQTGGGAGGGGAGGGLNGDPGGFGVAGAGGTSAADGFEGGGGGGGGYWGGGGGGAGGSTDEDAMYGAGGGGGSGYGPAGVVFQTGVRAGNGLVTITYSTDAAAPVSTIALDPASPDGQNGWYVSAVHAIVSAADEQGGSGVSETRCILDPPSVPASFAALAAGCDYAGAGADVSGDGEHVLYAASEDNAGNTEAPVKQAVNIDATAPTVTCAAAPSLVLNQADATVSANVSDATSGPAQLQVAAAADTTSVGAKTADVTGRALAGNATTKGCGYTVGYGFAGFLAPVDNLDAIGNPVLNVVKAGQALPLKWRLTDASGAPVTTLASAQITAAGITCTAGATTDQLEEVAAGASGLQNLGDGNYQLNWKSPTSYAGSCKRLRLDLGDGSSHTADFKFTK